MKRLFLLIYLLLIPSFAYSGIIASGSVSQANAKKSLVDGAAFVDLETLGVEIIGNGTFEAGGTGGDFDGGTEIDDATNDNFTEWNEIVNSGRIEATATVNSGSVAAMLTNTTGTTYTGLKVWMDIAVVAEQLYKLVFYTRGDGTYDGTYSIYDVSNSSYIKNYTSTGVTGTDHTRVTCNFTTPAGCISIRPQFTGNTANGSVIYYDDISIKPAATGIDLIPYAHADSGDHKHIFKLIDSATKVIWGYAGASGGGLTTSALTNNITGITKANPGVISSVAHGLSVGSLVYFSGLTEMTELNDTYKVVTVVGSNDLFSIDDTSGYGAAETTGGACGEEVTDCSTNGLHILSTKSGSVQNWAEIEVGFDYNDSSGYTYEIRTIGRGASIW